MTTAERDQIIKLMVGMFNAAPGSIYFGFASGVYEANGHNLTALAATLSASSAFQQVHPNSETAQSFANAFLSPFGLQGNASAVQFVVSRFNAGVDKATIITQAIGALDAIDPAVGGQLGTAAQILDNRAEVATFYSVTLPVPQTDFASLRNVIADVDGTRASVTAAELSMTEVCACAPTVLTPYQDTLLGGTTPDTFTAPLVTTADGTVQNTLQSWDLVNGAGGTDTLYATLQGGAFAAPTLTSIELVSFRSVGTTNTLDLANADSVTGVTVSGSTGNAVVAHIGAAQNLAVTNQNQDVRFSGSSASALKLSVNTVGATASPADQRTITIDSSQATDLSATVSSANVKFAGLSALHFAQLVATGSNRIGFDNSDGSLEAVSATGQGTLALDLSAITTPGPAISIAGAATAVNEIIGSQRNDVIAGGQFDDVIQGGRGADVLTGGGGKDTFVFAVGDADPAAPDVITDFAFGDVLRFRDVAAPGPASIRVGVFSGASEAAGAIRTEASTHHGAFLAALDATTGRLLIDANGDGQVDSVIVLAGVHTIGSDSFVFG